MEERWSTASLPPRADGGAAWLPVRVGRGGVCGLGGLGGLVGLGCVSGGGE